MLVVECTLGEMKSSLRQHEGACQYPWDNPRKFVHRHVVLAPPLPCQNAAQGLARGHSCLSRGLIIGYARPIDGESAVDRRGPGHVRGHTFSAPQGTIAVRAETAVTLPRGGGHSTSVCLPDFSRRDWRIADALENATRSGRGLAASRWQHRQHPGPPPAGFFYEKPSGAA